jgi:hypothetical protein
MQLLIGLAVCAAVLFSPASLLIQIEQLPDPTDPPHRPCAQRRMLIGQLQEIAALMRPAKTQHDPRMQAGNFLYAECRSQLITPQPRIEKAGRRRAGGRSSDWVPAFISTCLEACGRPFFPWPIRHSI